MANERFITRIEAGQTQILRVVEEWVASFASTADADLFLRSRTTAEVGRRPPEEPRASGLTLAPTTSQTFNETSPAPGQAQVEAATPGTFIVDPTLCQTMTEGAAAVPTLAAEDKESLRRKGIWDFDVLPKPEPAPSSRPIVSAPKPSIDIIQKGLDLVAGGRSAEGCGRGTRSDGQCPARPLGPGSPRPQGCPGPGRDLPHLRPRIPALSHVGRPLRPLLQGRLR
jgi:hypothetical protein